MWFICGLGNPDTEHKLTRHNLGFDVVDSLIKHNDFDLLKKDKNKILFKGKIEKKICYICKPQTYMNLSGTIISELTKFYKIPIEKIIIIHDDLDLTIGKIKIKVGGGNAGHNGLLSIDKYIGNNYKRIRIGIGRPNSKRLISKYVLERFLTNERKIIDCKIDLLVKHFSLIFENDNLFLTRISE